jgi:hypothetical protein
VFSAIGNSQWLAVEDAAFSDLEGEGIRGATIVKIVPLENLETSERIELILLS